MSPRPDRPAAYLLGVMPLNRHSLGWCRAWETLVNTWHSAKHRVGSGAFSCLVGAMTVIAIEFHSYFGPAQAQVPSSNC
jgi:hypothetical protein